MILLNISQNLKSEKNCFRNFLGLNRGAKRARNTRGVTGNKKEKKEKGKADNNKYDDVSFNYFSIPMTNHDRRSFINVLAGKLPHFDGTNFAM